MSSISATSSDTTTTTTTTNSTSSSDYLSFDTESLVEAKLASRYQRLDSLNTEISEIDSKIAAYQDMQDLLTDVSDSLQALRSDPSSSGQTDDVFLDRAAYLTSSTSSSADTYMAATVEDGADIAAHTIEISQIAQTNIVATAAQSSKSDDLGLSGTIRLGVEGGSTADIAVTATMSLADMADAINAETATSGVTASVMKVSEGEYLLVLSTADTGQTITAADVDGTLLSDSLGLIDEDGAILDGNILQDGQDAILKVDGVTVTRSSNDIDDLLEDVTLHLYAAPSDGAVLTLDVDNDLSAVKSAVTAFVEAYNSFRDFVLTNQDMDSEEALLFGDATLRAIAQTAQSVLTSAVDGVDLSQLGISLDEDNKLVLDETALDDALLDDFDAVAQLFSYSMQSSSGDLTLVRHPDSDLSFTLDVTVNADGSLASVAVGGDSGLFTISGSTIKGAEGTIYEGLTLVYSGTTSKSITVELTQGLADKLHYDVNAVADADNGSLAGLMEYLEDAGEDVEARASALEEQISAYAETLYSLYSNVAARMAEAQTMLDMLQALLDADNSS